ncbi:MAG: DNA primase [Candidatus Limivicinus sp.]|nr:DNA primase [Clostridiales bacterium]MCI7136163.1 DNA primase [Clostridiales bacterium]MDY6131873.1 DNA primase [Candidatus Limivicinus sp.]
MAFSESFLTELTERNDIVDVVSGYVRLGKKSGSNMFGLCPFHSEKTPSFSVSPDKQIYHCFGCGKGGGVINFIMEIENLSFPEAVEFLAKRAGMPIPEEENDRESRKRSRMLSLNRDAARFFYAQLSTPQGGAARDYMAKRRIGPATAKNFGIGFAPDTWDSLEKAMREKGYTDFELFDAGLVRKGNKGGYYDTFRNRLMFPVIDVRGNVIGFSGRILGDGEPKYMNSPETLVFNKSRNLFALNLAKKSKSGYIILSEGNIDVVSLHQAGFDSAVASLGTSLTPEQARLLSRYTNQVIIAYDNDGAGIKAAQRAIGILEKLDLKVKVLRMSGAKDPDEFIKLKGADAFRNLLESSENQIDYRLRSVTDKYDLSVDEQKVEFLKEASDLVARLPGSVERQVYAMRVASMSGVSADVVTKEVERRRKKLVNQARGSEERQQSRPERQLQPEEKALRYEDPSSAAAEEGLIRLLYLDPALARNAELPAPEEFSSPVLGHIYSVLRDKIDRGETPSAATLGGALDGQEMSLLVRLLQKPELLSKGDRALADYIKRIRERKEQGKQVSDLRALADKLRETKGYEG